MARKSFGGKTSGLKTWTNRSGYQKFVDPGTGRAEYTHRRVAEKKLGGKIFSGYEVHHRDGDKSNNRPENLQVLSKAAHLRAHGKGK